MNIKSYVNLYELLQANPSTREENRAFGLTQVMLQNKPIEQLLAWVEKHKQRLKKPLLSETFSAYLYRVTFVLVLIAFALGLCTCTYSICFRSIGGYGVTFLHWT